MQAQVTWLGQPPPPTFEDILRDVGLDNAPREAEVQEVLRQYRELLEGTTFPTNEEEALRWAEIVLRNYLQQQGIPTSEEEIKRIAEDYVRGQLEEAGVPTDFPTSTEDVFTTLQNAAITAAVTELGIDPRYVQVTIEIMADGKLDRQELEAIGGMAGAIAGAALAQAFGIPAPIGAFLGGEAGKLVGATIGQIFGIGKSAAELRAEQMREEIEAIRRWRALATQECDRLRNLFWSQFDSFIIQMERSWERLEQQVGFRFGLRWFGDWPFGQPLDWMADKQASVLARLAVVKEAGAVARVPSFSGDNWVFRCRPDSGDVCFAPGEAGCPWGQEWAPVFSRCQNINNPRFVCSLPTGCSYPETEYLGADFLGSRLILATPATLSQVIPTTPVESLSRTLMPYERVAEAYFLRAPDLTVEQLQFQPPEKTARVQYKWLPPDQRRSCELPPGAGLLGDNDPVIRALRNEAARLNGLIPLTIALAGDLAKTGAAYGAFAALAGASSEEPAPPPRTGGGGAGIVAAGVAIAAGLAWLAAS